MPFEASEISLEEYRLFLFVGAADSGKSFAATSFGLQSKKYGGVDDRFCYMLELDGRTAALKDRPITLDTYTNEDGAIGVLKRVKELRDNAVKFKKVAFHTLIFDSFTTYNDFAIADSQEITIKKGERTMESAGRVRGELQMLTTEDYGYEAESWRQLMYECLHDLKRYCNVIVIAHETEQYRKVRGLKPGEPTSYEADGYKILAHGNKVAARIPTKFDEIYHFLPKEKLPVQRNVKRQVVFLDELARTSIPKLQNTTPHDISGKEFFPYWKGLISGTSK